MKSVYIDIYVRLYKHLASNFYEIPSPSMLQELFLLFAIF